MTHDLSGRGKGKKMAPNKNSIESEKLNLEVALLRRQLEKSRFYEAFIDKWVPSLIAVIVLFTLVPLANFIL